MIISFKSAGDRSLIVNSSGVHLDNCLEISSKDTENLKTIEFLTSFAPLHNASATSMIKSFLKKITPKAINYGCFDTAFHVASMDPVQYRYPVREDAAGKGLPGGMSLRKWGFHGLSYSSVTRSVSRYLGKSESSLNLIICHLSSGASICAIKGGKSFDTSMGLTPLKVFLDLHVLEQSIQHFLIISSQGKIHLPKRQMKKRLAKRSLKLKLEMLMLIGQNIL